MGLVQVELASEESNDNDKKESKSVKPKPKKTVKK